MFKVKDDHHHAHSRYLETNLCAFYLRLSCISLTSTRINKVFTEEKKKKQLRIYIYLYSSEFTGYTRMPAIEEFCMQFNETHHRTDRESFPASP